MATTSVPRTVDAVRRPRRSLRFTRDDELVRLVRCGDESAFEAIYDRHHRGILAFCRHMLGSREEGEDAVQHTFAAAYRDLTGTDKPIQLKAWLYAIARNRCLSVLRARRDQVSLEDAEPSTEGLASEVQRRQDLRDLLRDLRALPEDQRAALVLSELGALSHEEVGVSLGVRKEKVKALVFQARESLASSREARDADCHEIQEQLSVLRGGALRRSSIKRHVDQCPACAEFKAEVQRQRAAMAIILPVVPSAGLKACVLAAITGGGAAGGGAAIAAGGAAAGGGLLAASGAKGLAAKVLTIAAAAGIATGGGLMAINELSDAPAESRDPLALAPPEQASIRFVNDLRRRADQTAQQRTADVKAAVASGAAPAPHAKAPAPKGGGKHRSKQASAARAKLGTRNGHRPTTRGAVTAAGGAPGTTSTSTTGTGGGTAPTANLPAPTGTPAAVAGAGERGHKAKKPKQAKGPKHTPPGQEKKAGGGFHPPGQSRRRSPVVPPGIQKKNGGGFSPPGRHKAPKTEAAPEPEIGDDDDHGKGSGHDKRDEHAVALPADPGVALPLPAPPIADRSWTPVTVSPSRPSVHA